MVSFLAKANEDPVEDDDDVDIEKTAVGSSTNSSTEELKLADQLPARERPTEELGKQDQNSMCVIEVLPADEPPHTEETGQNAPKTNAPPKTEAPKKTWTKRIIAGVWEITTPALVAAIVSLIIVGAKPFQVTHINVKYHNRD
jgi:hypothetical protein